MQIAKHHRTTRLAWTLIVIGTMGLVISALVYVRRPTMPGPTSVDVTSAPSSAKPSTAAVADYQVAPTLPKYLAIPAIGINNSRIIQLGLTNKGQIAAPDNIYDPGWYSGSAKPGQPGAAFMYGHVSNWQANGIFYNLKQLKPGSKIVITRGDDQSYTYQVTTTKIYPYNKVDMKAVLSPINPNQPGLNLMTCTGQIIKGTSQFNERLVVFASLVKS